MSYDDLSSQQEKILMCIKKEILTKGYPPSVREICKAVGLRSTSTVHGHLNTLEQKGYIRKGNNKRRAIEVIDTENNYANLPRKEVVNLPIVGTVTAGQPILAVQNIEDTLPISTDFIGTKESFVLKVKGDSMINAGILDGDYVIVNVQNTATNGEIVVALIEDEATVKTFYKEDNHIRLQPENNALDPIIVDSVNILGTVKCVIRKY